MDEIIDVFLVLTFANFANIHHVLSLLRDGLLSRLLGLGLTAYGVQLLDADDPLADAGRRAFDIGVAEHLLVCLVFELPQLLVGQFEVLECLLVGRLLLHHV